jgi:hypothetical protein
VLAHFIEEAELSDAEIRELKKRLDQKRATQPRSKGEAT